MSSLATANAAVADFMRGKTFKLQVDLLEESTFFDLRWSRRDLPQISIPPVLLNNQARPKGPGLLAERERKFFEYNGDVWISDEGLADFAEALLELFEYDKPNGRVIEKRKKFIFTPPGEAEVPIEIDVVAALHNGHGEYLLFVLNASGKNPNRGIEYEPTIVAAALVAFRESNAVRIANGQFPAHVRDFACIVMIGTAPIFYRISIGNQLAQNLDQVGQSLTIRKFVPPVADQSRYVVEGMVPLENRKLVFKYLEEFRKLILIP